MDEYPSGFCIRASRGGGGTGTKCGRWNPTSEQVKVLTELFRSGVRTPSTDQIQKISSQLSCYGKIESKNVFYWFQNHKARERQKRRRVLVDEPSKDQIMHHLHDNTITTKHFGDEINHVPKAERVIQTLQLFPLNSLNDAVSEKLNVFSDNCKVENASIAYNLNISAHHHEMGHPTLDLRLSFV